MDQQWKFDGAFPEPAPAALQVSASGVETLPKVATVDHPTNGAAIGILRGDWAKAERRVLTIGFPVGGVNDGGSFPPEALAKFSQPGSVDCGITDVSNAPIGGIVAEFHLACVLEYGTGASSQKIYFDWVPGSYNIPPCEFVRVSALPWGLNWNSFGQLNWFPVVASVSPGELQGAHVPTASQVAKLTAATPVELNSPAGARAFEVACVDNGTPVITVQNGINATRDYAAKSNFPGWTPLTTSPNTQVTVVSDVDTTVALTWYIAL